MRDMRNERVRRAGVREERLRATAGLKGAINLSSWRGRSGRRYVVGVHPLSESEILELANAVILAVRRDGDDLARLIDVATVGERPRGRSRAGWVAAVRAQGATEMHVHRLAATDAERRAIIDDLLEDEVQAS
jgi:hypothetical protein